jgi:hypothetical protein
MASRPIGQIFVDLGFVTTEDLDEALELQRARDTLIGETLIAQGKLSRLDLASALSHQWYVDAESSVGQAGGAPEAEVGGPPGLGAGVDPAVARLQITIAEFAETVARLEAARLETDVRLAAIESALASPA